MESRVCGECFWFRRINKREGMCRALFKKVGKYQLACKYFNDLLARVKVHLE